MTQNTSSAVMAQRREPHKSLDDFPTPPWATRALCERLRDRGYIQPWHVCREPAANRGHMVKPLQEYFDEVKASDIFDYGAGFVRCDYLFGQQPPSSVNWTITNPPFRLATEFILRAIDASSVGAAFIVRTAFLESIGRFDRLFRFEPPSLIWQFSERVVMHKGKLSEKGSTATAYCWLVWLKDRPSVKPQFDWIGPCRARLELPGDYPRSDGAK